MKLTAIPRITLGLVSLAIGLLLAFDLLLHLFPNEADTTRELRQRQGRSLAIQTAALLQARDLRAVERTLTAVQAADPEILSLGLRRADGALVAQAGDHLRRWQAPAEGSASSQALVLGILSEQRRWGGLEIMFRPLHQRALGDWLFSGPTKLLALFSVAASLLYFVYLRRMLQHLDPTAAVPERVRGAFDALTEGVLIVDAREQILLSNRSFQALAPAADRAGLVGRRASALGWLAPVEPAGDPTPWLTSMRSRAPVRGQSFRIRQDSADGAGGAKVVVNCSPLPDEQGNMRGCLVTLDDVTALERSHEQLLEVLADLATSKDELEQKNSALEDLANRDPLSGCLNRRAFYASFQPLFAQARQQGSELVCIMADIDHFKSINDRYGHAVGDEAIKAFAEILRQGVRPGDLVGRYGGEEFVVVAAGMGVPRALALADTLRERLAAERRVGRAEGHDVRMSASFGVASIAMGPRNEAGLVDLADRAMYLAKQGGRNRVVLYQPPDEPAPTALPAPAARPAAEEQLS